MGGLAAAAAAALLVGVHSGPTVGSRVPVAPAPVASRVAVVPIQTEVVGGASAIAAPVASVAAKMSPLGEHKARPEVVPTREPILPGHSEPRAATAPHPAHRSLRHRALMLAAFTHPTHRKHQRTRSSLIAGRPVLVPAVTEATLAQALQKHEAAVPSPEGQWQDQVVAIRRTATVAPADDGYGEASSKDLVTGMTDKSMAIGSAPSPAIPAGEPAGNTGGNK
jgi:hypothetical protein